MPKKRRKLNKEMEQEIASAKRKVEFITAIINDIEEEDIQGDYIVAFEPIKMCVNNLAELYDEHGFNDDSVTICKLYKQLLERFESEYET